ncbi:hypothetical protein EPA93_34040 [Ktedonosporobacter rubrisoli]|uniref:Uncharacterized protein n=1 Tax=Ktedonosporobacter rubrisoli TaxID=2509675 RepID=A0A4P6JZ08_KTERU|nr:hypothetical protein [Ktedonosporobacter rubrisoli]QBD80723.1 hypothetical protein EPA93_34040 [Ktedonosporobacter rubrisoli]
MEMLSQRTDTAKVTIVQYVLLAWFFLALGASLAGWFVGTPTQPPLAFGLAAIVPILLFFLVYLTSNPFRRFVHSLNLIKLTAWQFYRVIGVTMLVLYSKGMLPASFAQSAGWGDIIVGITAPLAALALASGTRWGRGVFLTWNVLGLLDLLSALGLGMLLSGTRLSPLTSTINTSIMSMFPMSLIPTFLVPLSIILHLIGFYQLRRRSRA